MKPSLLKISRFCAILVGLVLLASGLLKLLDPVGTGLIVQEYCRFLHLDFLSGVARWAGVALALLESVLGTALLTGVYRRATAVATQILLAVFTLITILLVVFKPEMDCGCFGEAVHLTHSQSLLKNLILLALVAVAFLPFKDLGEPKKRKYYAFWAVFAGLAVAAVYNQFHLPAVDFTEFAPGNELFASRDDSPEEADVFVAQERQPAVPCPHVQFRQPGRQVFLRDPAAVSPEIGLGQAFQPAPAQGPGGVHIPQAGFLNAASAGPVAGLSPVFLNDLAKHHVPGSGYPAPI